MHLPRPGEGGNFKPVPGGSYPAICYRVIDLGTQRETYLGEEKRLHKVLLSFEIKDDDCKMDDGKPMSIHQKYTWSMHEKATLRKHLESWRGQAFKDSDFGPGGFDIRNLLGKACMLAVTNKQGQGDKVYSNITSISRLPKQMAGSVGELDNPTLYFSLEEFDADAFRQLSKSMQERIQGAPEYHDAVHGKPSVPEDEANGQSDQFGRMDDEVPF